MRALITGAGGLLGHALALCLARRETRVWGAFRQPPGGWPYGSALALDLAAAPGREESPEAVVAGAEPEVVFHLAALTDVDHCETDPAAAWRVNARGSARVARAALAAGAGVVYMSTDYVFDGAAGGYSEAAPPAPINSYGRSKLGGEAATLAAHPSALVVRATLYGLHPDGRGGLARLLARLQAGTPITVHPDAWFTPLPAPELAARLASLAAAGTGGIRHLPGPRCSRWEFAAAAARCFGLDPALVRAGVPANRAGAPRPLDTSLTTLHPGPWPAGWLAADLAMVREEATP